MSVTTCGFADFDAHIDIMAALQTFSVVGDDGVDAIFDALDALTTKGRRIIDQWDMGVKWKISLSFKGIIHIVRAAGGVGSELWREMFQRPMHGGFGLD